MPFPFQVILVAGATGYILTALLFLATRSMPGVNPGTLWWSISSLAAAGGYIVLLAMGLSGDPQTGEAIYNMLFVLWVLGLYIGGKKFLGLEVKQKPLIMAALFVTIWLGYFYFASYSFLASAIVVALFCGVLNIHLAWLFWKKGVRHGIYLNALVVALFISGLHWLDYPLLRPVESFAPIGFSLCAIISVIISSLLAGMVLKEFRRHMLMMRQSALDVANHDPLTGLSNRMALENSFKAIVARDEAGETKLALIYFDLDNFKPINDSLGHKIGDEVLVKIAHKIKALVRSDDIVARVGGDEFVVVLSNLHENIETVTQRLCEQILETVKEPIEVGKHTCLVGVSLGVVCAEARDSDLDNLMHLADEAMYKAKAQGKGRCEILCS